MELTASEFQQLIKTGVIKNEKGKLTSQKLIPEYKTFIKKKGLSLPSETKEDERVLVFFDLPKISLNKFYAGMHWSDRNKIKDNYHTLIPVLADIVFPIIVSYQFYFKRSPLDASNCVGMIKLIEDVLFDKNDAYGQIKIGGISSDKGQENKVIVTIKNDY